MFYSYYTTYNNGGVNQFFDLVPPMYRLGYDEALKKALQNAGNSDIELGKAILGNDGNTDTYGAFNVTELLDVICKNFWYDDAIVPEVILAENKNKGQETKILTRMTPKDIHDVTPLREIGFQAIDKKTGVKACFSVPGSIASRAYVKVKYGKGDNRKAYLYKKIAVQYAVMKTKNGETRRPVKNVYLITNKLGLKNGRNKVYEFGFNTNDSAFDDNRLYGTTTDGTTKPIKVPAETIVRKLQTSDPDVCKRFGKDCLRIECEQYRDLVHDDDIEVYDEYVEIVDDTPTDTTKALPGPDVTITMPEHAKQQTQNTQTTQQQAQDDTQQTSTVTTDTTTASDTTSTSPAEINDDEKSSDVDVTAMQDDAKDDGKVAAASSTGAEIDASAFASMFEFAGPENLTSNEKLSDKDDKEADDIKNNCKS